LQTINTNSRQKILLEVYNNGVLSQVDTGTHPTLSIYDADNDASPIAGFSNLTATDDSPVGVYSYLLPTTVTAINRVLEIRWTYVTGGVTTNQTSFYTVESPYSSIAETLDFLGASPSSSASNYIDPKSIVSAEKLARTIIEGYTGVKFYTYYGSQEIWGIGADALQLTERILDIDLVYEDDILIIDNTQNPIYNTFGFNLVITPTGKQIRINYPGWDLRYDNQIDPTVLYYGRFRNGSRYKFVGQMGYKYVPEDIKLASMMLVNDIISNDYNWRNKYLAKVDLSEISFEMAKGAFNGTGNVAVDNILDQYRNVNIVII
jgi:hypothetical protein